MNNLHIACPFLTAAEGQAPAGRSPGGARRQRARRCISRLPAGAGRALGMRTFKVTLPFGLLDDASARGMGVSVWLPAEVTSSQAPRVM
ncbi:Hypothetical predicted protein [Podarcis lilfordi]|uniref:Uncharacterized protein n=1 Tax=Podarcis lilfordi TaxID=74358 RepID=A0AA35JXF2_9SAUR|nr:Hypothetical predicted protein [Podarcis lilfordi]